MASRRSAYQAVNGVLLLDKPLGFSSNKALQKIRHLFCAKKAGHTGSLDPLATGVLPICFGDATKFSQYLLNSNKSYQVVGQLGSTTSTGDKEGEILSRTESQVNQRALLLTLEKFRGHIQQVPPMYSALKHKGQPLYKLARAGKDVIRAPRAVCIDVLQLLTFSFESQTFQLQVTCSKGTYIRSLVEDIGQALGVGAHVMDLRRTAVDDFDIGQTYSMDYLMDVGKPEELLTLLLPMDICVAALPEIKLDKIQSQQFTFGQKISIERLGKGDEWRVYDPTCRFIGVGLLSETGILSPKRLIATV